MTDRLNAEEMEYIVELHNHKCAYCTHMELWNVYPYKVCRIRKDNLCQKKGCKEWEWNGIHPF